MRVKLTPAFVQRATCPPDKAREYFWDTSMAGFGLLVTSAGHKSFVAQSRISRSRSPRLTLKGTLPLSTAKREAKRFIGDVARGVDTLAEERAKARTAAGTLRSVAENYFKREGGTLRSIGARRRTFERLIYPVLGAMPIEAIKRSHIAGLQDKVEDENGPRQADLVRDYLGRLFNWHAGRSDNFNSPLVRGAPRRSKAQPRARVLDDAELAAVWKAASETGGAYGAYVRFVLLCACRRDEARWMTHSEIVNGVWTIPASRYKTGVDCVLPLSKAAQSVLAGVPKIGNSDFCFTLNGRNPISGLAKFKHYLDEASGVRGWTTHDLRRTARSLMSRAGVSADIAEICLGHTLGGVRGVYDRHSYLEEKRIAFEKLATLIESIVNPQANVVPLVRA